jgi:hypothetical protein
MFAVWYMLLDRLQAQSDMHHRMAKLAVKSQAKSADGIPVGRAETSICPQC